MRKPLYLIYDMFSYNLLESCSDVVGISDCPALRYDFEDEDFAIQLKTSTDKNFTDSPYTNNGVITCL